MLKYQLSGFKTALERKKFDEKEMEEERRLCYVGITRAKEELFMTMTGKRTLYGRTNHSVASRFIEELPDDCIERLNRVQKEIPYSKASYNMLDKYTKKYMNSVNKAEIAKKAQATIKEKT